MARTTVLTPDDEATDTVRHARWQDYFQLMKPRVMSLVVFTALTGLLAARTPIHPLLGAVAVFCIAVGAGASVSTARASACARGAERSTSRRSRARVRP